MDEFIDQLLHEVRVCEIQLPRMPKRQILVDNGDLGPRISLLDEELAQQADAQE